MLDGLAKWIHAARRRLAFSFPIAVLAAFLAVEYTPRQYLGQTLGLINGLSGVYLGMATLYLYQSSPRNKKEISFGNRHPLVGLLGSLFFFMGWLITFQAGGLLLWRIVSEEPKSDPQASSQVSRSNRASKAPDMNPPKLRPKSHADCKRQPTCKGCLRAPLQGDDSTCVPAKLRTAQEFPLTKDKHGLSGRLLLLVDDRWHRPEEESYRGHRIDDSNPLAAAVLRVVGEDGETVDEVEDLHPAVSGEVTNLGDGTETFLVTQEFLCVAGRYCGWDTRFIQVHEGKLTVLEAAASDGKVEQAWFTSSQAAGWKLIRAGDGEFDILHQSFGFDEMKGETDTQTRFYFWKGKWRVVSDTVYVTAEDREPSANRPSGHR